MKPFLEKIADRLLKKFPEKMDSIAVVLPSKRSVVFLKKYLSEKITKPIFLPQFYSIEEFIEKISELKVIDNVSLQFYLYKSYLKVKEQNEESFNDFLNWSNTLLQDFNDIDTNMVDAKMIFTNLQNVKELENWDVDQWSFSSENLSEKQKEYIDFFSSLYYIYQTFKDDLLDQNYAYQGLANLIAAEKISSLKIEWERVWFVGLNALTKSQHLIIDNLKQRNIARVFWDADKYYFDNHVHEASYFLKQQKYKWNEIDFDGVGDYLSQPKQSFNIISCPQNIAQAQAMSMILSEIKKEDLIDSKTAIILADEGLLFPVLNNIPENINKLNVTMGSPFQKTPFYTFINSFLNLKYNSIKASNASYYYKDLFLLIDDPYFIKIINENELNNLKDYIVNENLIFINQNEILNFISDKSFEEIFYLTEDVFKIIDQLKSIIYKLQKLSIKNKDLVDAEIIFTFLKSIEIVERHINEFTFKIDFKSLMSLIDRIVAKEIIPFKGEPLEGVQLMGILESRALDFKNVIILGVNEGILPKGRIINSLIPLELKRYYKIPTYSERDAIFSYHFYRILQRASNVTLTYNSSIDEFGFGEKSRFITQLLSEYNANQIKELVFHDDSLSIAKKELTKIKSDCVKSEIISWAKSGVSPTALNMYKRCSLEFYINYLVKIREPKQIDEFADNSLMGSAVHSVLENFYEIDEINLQCFNNYSQKIKDCLLDYYKDYLSLKNYNIGKNYLSIKVAERLLNDCLSYEKKVLEEGNKIIILEKEKELEYNFELENYTFKLVGNIDRVDFFNQNLRIIDYKTGKKSSKNELLFDNWDDIIDKPKNDKIFQLLMYAYLYLKNNPKYLNQKIQVGIYFLRDVKNGFDPLQKKGGLLFDDEFIHQFEIQLTRLFRRIIENDFEENDDIKLCEYCTHLDVFI